MSTAGKVLIVDDEANARRVLKAILCSEGYSVIESPDVERAVAMLHREPVQAIITDVKMPHKDGYHLFEYVTENHPGLPVMFLTAYGTVESAVHAMTNGAFYYFIKPPDYRKLKTVLASAIQQHSEQKAWSSDGVELSQESSVHALVGRTPQVAAILTTIEMVKDSESSVLIHGETGTGKEIVACALHDQSVRRDKPFVAVNCAAMPRDLIEAELFGSEKGAFTGAVSARRGKFEEAGDGTMFLDEIGELELTLQAKLLRVLQERTIERLGSNKKTKVNFRLICSTNRDLSQEVAAGRFREDLYYRINVIKILVPPLRDRGEDLPFLARNFVQEFCRREKKQVALSDEVLDLFLSYSWPGNVRQLKNVIERAVVLANGRRITARDIAADIHASVREQAAPETIRPLRELELGAIRQAIQDCQGNKSQAARKLCMSRKALYRRLKEASGL